MIPFILRKSNQVTFKSFSKRITRSRFSIINKHILIERDLKSDLSLKNIIKNKEITEDILPSADVQFDVQKQETGSAYPEVKGQFEEEIRIL